MQDHSTGLPRAGVWRRAAAGLIDALAISLPCAVLASLLFWSTAGYIQASAGFDVSTCESKDPVPDHLVPAPPAASNFATACRLFSFAGQTGSTLTVGHIAKGDNYTKQVARTYMLDAGGQVVQGIDWSWGFPVVLLVYLILAQVRWGRTLGLRTVRTRLVLQSNPMRGGVPLSRLLVRYAVLIGGFVPGALVVALGLYGALRSSDDTPPSGILLAVAPVLLAGWSLWNIVLAARKRDPIYDRIAGTAVIRVPPAPASA